MSGFKIPDLTRERQDRASRPRASAWVSANAGSGKTFVLSRRVVRLLLDGTDPSRILALTFTKAAAAEMATRVFKILGTWVTMDDAILAAELTDIEGRVPDAARLALARRLFARALETPGGLKIQTIHGFCEALLHQFPLEANVAGHFQVLDDRIAGELMAGAQASILHTAETHPDSALGRSLATVVDLMSDGGAQNALEELIRNRDALRRWTAEAGGLEAALSDLATELGVDPELDLSVFDRRFREETELPLQRCRAFAEALRTGTKTDVERAEALCAAAEVADIEAFRIQWLKIFLTAEQAPRKTLATKAIITNYPHVVEALASEQMRLVALLDRRRAMLTYAGTAALLRLAHGVTGHYEAAKTARGYLDFEDLVVKTARLLSRSEAALWVQYKLDQGLDHILVDEAQDTSPRQWEVVASLAQEFFAGEGASRRVRTVFAVGDEKQSIYSFQGAVPAYFDLMRRSFARQAQSAEHEFHSVDLQLSFRSTPDVLGAVDQVFLTEEAHRGLSQEVKPPVHEAIRRDPGIVDLWPLERFQAVTEPEDWRTPIDHIGTDNPMTKVAHRIAATIKGWMRAGEVDPGDVMILVRKRGAFVDVLNRALKQFDIPAAGSDRLILTDHIAVQDLAALGRFLLLPEDDLSLAAVLKSPLFDLTDDDLLEVARDTPAVRRPGTLWQMLLKRADTSETWRAVRIRLEAWRGRADFMPPFEFYSRLLSADGGRRAFRRRLGAEVDDVLDEFLALTIAFEQAGPPGLEGFLAWLGAAPAEIKRELSTTKGLVRIMTVHGSKGLESKIVILVDPGSAPTTARHDPAFLPRARGADDAHAPALVWLPTKADRLPWHAEALDQLRAGQEEEYRRLLYVALTRAEDRLIVCGWEPKSGAHDRCWYNMVSGALKPAARELKETDGSVIGWRWQKPDTAAAPASPGEPSSPVERASAKAESAPDMPDWLSRPAPAFERKTRLQPSRVFETMELKDGVDPVPALSRLEARRQPDAWPLERGRLIHRLLETLPELDPEARIDAAVRFVDTALPERFGPYRDALLGEVRAILDAPDLRPLFARSARAEVPIVGTLTAFDGKQVEVSGQIDRLVVTKDTVLIVDYKTNLIVPQSPGGVALEYRAQLAVYRALVQQIYPDRPVNAAVLWTSAPSLMELPANLLDETFASLRGDGVTA